MAWHTFFKSFKRLPNSAPMKSLATLIILLGWTYTAQAQSDAVPNGSQSSGDNGRAYSNGYIPSPYEQNQNRPDSTLRSDDTTYMHQQWNDGSAQKQNANNKNQQRNTSTHKTATKSAATTTKKK
jgi:hypothetical protein